MGNIRHWLPFSVAEKAKIEHTKDTAQRVLAGGGKPETLRERQRERDLKRD